MTGLKPLRIGELLFEARRQRGNGEINVLMSRAMLTRLADEQPFLLVDRIRPDGAIEWNGFIIHLSDPIA